MPAAVLTAEAPVVKVSIQTIVNSYEGRPFLLSGSTENTAIAKLASLEGSGRVDIVDTIINLQVSPMFGKLIEQYETDLKLHPDCAVLEMCARMYLAGRESISASHAAGQ